MKKPYYLSLKLLVPWKETERPCVWARRFGREAPIELEIGFGNGAALVRRAAEHPERDFIGVEIFWESVKRALRRAAQAGVANLAIVQAPARPFLERLVAPRALSAAVCLFPCPWPKERHAAHRLFSKPFLDVLNSRLADGGETEIVTDFEPYRDWLLEQVPGTGFEARWEEIPASYGTKYEQKWSDLGRERFFRIVLAKREHVGIPFMRDETMRIHTIDRFDPEGFRPKGTTGVPTVQFKEFLYDPQRRKGMLRAFVAEEGLQQHFWIEVAEVEGRWKIRPAEGSGILPTAGAQLALDLARDAAAG
ncbi:MAG: hypothetical protein FJY73_08835 [Candidatus Eisenbacteria bacterium]|nr:hypothetical protein [Candidatus Eisenbacteria bacterium]